MHGMLSSAVVLAAFAVIAGAGGYTALWLYRVSSARPATSSTSSTLGNFGWPARSWFTPESAPSGPVPPGPDGGFTTAPPAAPLSGPPVPGKIISQNAHTAEHRPRVTFVEGDEPDPVDEIDAAGELDGFLGGSGGPGTGPGRVAPGEPSRAAVSAGDRACGAGGSSADGSGAGGSGEAGDAAGSPGARVYVLGQSRRSGR